MNAYPPSRRSHELAIRLYHEIAWPRYGQTRYLSCLIIPLAAKLMVPGWWWLGCLGLIVTAIILDHVTDLWVRRQLILLPNQRDVQTQRTVSQLTWRAAGIVALYTAPSLLLAFAPHPGSIIGLMFSMAAAISIASQHVMTSRMIFYTFPFLGFSMLACASQFETGWVGVGLVMLGLLACLNAVRTSAAGALSFETMISARLAAEESAAELENRVALRTAELTDARALAESANAAKSAFLANMSHELRTPLNAVLGFSEIIQEDLAEGNTENCQKDLQRVINASNHLLTLINEVLDLSRIEAGKLDLRWEKHDIAALAQNALETVCPLAAKSETVCTLIMEGEIGSQWVDATRLRQCLLNLLSNAAKFTVQGEIRLCVSVVGANTGDMLQFIVRDTGPGMGPEDLQRLFKPFVQLDDESTRRHQGAGLGLSITRRLARLMGGDVAVESALGHGSAFTLSLPLHQSLPQERRDAQRAA